MKSRRQTKYFYIFISPWLLGFFALTMIPLVYSIYLSLTEYNALTPPQFVGLRNYSDLIFHDSLFWKALGNSMLYAVMAVPSSLLLALVLALLLSKESKASSVFQIIFFFPSIAAGAAVFTVLKYLLKGEGGLLNYILSFFGIQGPNWLSDGKWAMIALVMANLIFCGQQMLIFMAGIKQIPETYYEAARMDGAGKMSCFFHITFPQISQVFVFNLIMGIISAFQVFVQPLIMTAGGPLKKTYMYGMYIYDSGFAFGRFGYAASLAWIMYLIILFVSGVVLKGVQKLMNNEE